MRHIKKYQEYADFNEGLASLTGKVISKIEKGIKSFGSRISLTGKDEDLAKNIENYVNQLPETYNPNIRYQKDQIHRQGNTDYFVIYSKDIFPNAHGAEFRVDIINASDPSIGLHEDPYRIIISKVAPKGSPERREIGTFRRQDQAVAARRSNLGQEVGQLATPNANKTEEFMRLDCSQPIAKKIFDIIKHKWELSNPNTKGLARGNQNTNTRQPGRVGSLTWR